MMSLTKRLRITATKLPPPRSAALSESLVQGLARRTSPDRGQRYHLMHTPQRCLSDRNGSPAFHQTRVEVAESNTGESRELVATDDAGFR